MLDFLKNVFKAQNSTSPAKKLDITDVKKLIRDALCVGASAVLAYVATNVTHLDLGTATVILVPLFDTIISAGLKWLKDNGPQTEVK